MCEWVSAWVGEWVSRWVSEQMNKRVFDWLIDWVCEWISKSVKQRVCGFVVWLGGSLAGSQRASMMVLVVYGICLAWDLIPLTKFCNSTVILRNASDAIVVSVGVPYQNNSNSNYNWADRKHNNAIAALGCSYCQWPDLSALRNALCAAVDMQFSNDGSAGKVTIQLLSVTIFMGAISSGKMGVTTEP
jgi:hypothetical protein